MSEAMHPAAPHHLPNFITAPGETDVLFTGSVVFLVLIVVLLGSLYFRLHALPERIAHGTSQLQYQLVAVLALIALFTHNNLFWVAALLLALIPIPDFFTPLSNMSESLARMAGLSPRFTSAGSLRPEEARDGAAPISVGPSESIEPRQQKMEEMVSVSAREEGGETTPLPSPGEVASPPPAVLADSVPPVEPRLRKRRAPLAEGREP